jgi:hypothetical protein
MKICETVLFSAALLLGNLERAEAVIFSETADPAYHTTTPGDNSGWQYEGKFGDFLGVPIGPFHFITANHIGGSTGDLFDFHGDLYTTIAHHDISATDLRIWEVDHAKPFPTYAPLSSGVADIGATATIIGRGTQRGSEVYVGGELKGWQWGAGDGVQRWGRNVVVSARENGLYLYCDFDKPGVTDECHLSVGDSGGGMFVFEKGLWKLAGINRGVDGPFRYDSSGSEFLAALYDAGGLEYKQSDNLTVWSAIPEQAVDVPTGFYCSQISESLAAIFAIAPEAATLATEDFTAWQRLYFRPTEIATPATSGPLADPDHDGIGNLLEFALNLDPTFSERATMTADTGVRGLPLAGLATISSADHLTLEFVRRTSGSGAALTCKAEFSSDLVTWSTTGTETITAINSRWERVKTVDSLTMVGSVHRFARMKAE